MGFEDELAEAFGSIATGGDGVDDEAMNQTARGALFHQELGDDPTVEDFKEVIEQLKEEGKSPGKAQMEVRAPMMVLGGFEDVHFERLNEALEAVYNIEI